MTPKKKSILFRIFGKDEISAKLGAVTKKLQKAGKVAQNVGRNLTTKLSLPILALGVGSTIMFANFDDSMRKVQAISGATGVQFQQMTALAEEMGRTTRFTARESASAMVYLAQAGLNTQQIMGALPGVLQLAAAGGIELSEAADLATDVMTSMGLKIKDLSYINDVLAKGSTSATTTLQQLGEALAPVASTASSLGIPLKTVTAHLAALANASQKGSIAGTLLRNAYIAYAKTGRPLSKFNNFISELNKSNASAPEIIKAFGERGGRAFLGLMKTGGSALDALQDKIHNSKGAAKEMAATMESGLGGTIRRVRSALEGVAITIGRTMEPVLTKIAGKIEILTQKFQNLSPRTRRIILVVLGLVAAVGPLLMILGTFMTLITPLTLKIVAIGAAIGALVGFVVWLWKKWKDMTVVGKLLFSILFPFPIAIMATVKATKKLVEWTGKLIDKFKSPEFAGIRDFFAKIAKFGGKILFKQEPGGVAPTAGAGGMGAIARGATNTINRNTTNTSRVQIEVSGPKGTKVRSDAGGNDLDIVARGPAFSF